MTLAGWLKKWGMQKLKFNIGILDVEWAPQELDREAAWELYIEMLTRIVTQPLSKEGGDEKTALDSVYALFPVTRDILKRKGRGSVRFTMIAIVVLNQIVRPFTAKWHRLSLAGAFTDPAQCSQFRSELEALQEDLSNYTRALADLAQVEDLTDLEQI